MHLYPAARGRARREICNTSCASNTKPENLRDMGRIFRHGLLISMPDILIVVYAGKTVFFDLICFIFSARPSYS